MPGSNRESIQAFAGETISKAVFYPEDDDGLTSRELHADHWEIIGDLE